MATGLAVLSLLVCAQRTSDSITSKTPTPPTFEGPSSLNHVVQDYPTE